MSIKYEKYFNQPKAALDAYMACSKLNKVTSEMHLIHMANGQRDLADCVRQFAPVKVEEVPVAPVIVEQADVEITLPLEDAPKPKRRGRPPKVKAE